MINEPRPVTAARPNESIAADALVRIPTAHFGDITWAKAAVTSCLCLIARGFAGDERSVTRWIDETALDPRADALSHVFAAVCDASIAQAYRTRTDVTRVTTFITAFEQDVLARLAALHERGVDEMNDSDTAELAAGLVRVVQMHDADTATHLDATGALGRRIAVAMGLPVDVVTTIELAGRLHDIGKVGVRKQVLCKAGPLDADEWTEMRFHAEAGASVLLDTPKLAYLAPIVRAHHERIDGNGYPDRLRAHEIPLESRVVAVADAFHAMTTERSYRRAMMPNDALAVLAEYAGSQFDVDVVEATFELFRYARRPRRAIA